MLATHTSFWRFTVTATIDYTTENAVGSIFTTANFTDELHKYLGLDPAVAAANQPIDITELLTTVLRIVEEDQWRVILPKTITLRLPYSALNARDNRIYLPYGRVSTLTTFAYTDTSSVSQTLDSANYTLASEEPAYLWNESWHSEIKVNTKSPDPITLTYTTGYDQFDKIPRPTLQAIRLLCYHHFVNRSMEHSQLPDAYRHHVGQHMLNNRRLQEYL